jgi:hypothetical protein
MATYKVRIRGTAPYLQHRYPMPDEEQRFKEECESKGLDPKKTSNIEASWYQNSDGAFIPAEHLKQALVGAGKGEKVGGKGNATWNNVLKVAAAVLPAEISFLPAKKSYDFVHQAYAKVGMARVLRERPAFAKGWEAEFTLEADASEIDEKNLHKFIGKAGRRGIGDYRPEKGGSFGTFELVEFKRIDE